MENHDQSLLSLRGEMIRIFNEEEIIVKHNSWILVEIYIGPHVL